MNNINPGVVETPLQRRGGMSDEAYGAFLQRSIEVTHPLGSALKRVAQPEEVAELAAFLCSEKVPRDHYEYQPFLIIDGDVC